MATDSTTGPVSNQHGAMAGYNSLDVSVSQFIELRGRFLHRDVAQQPHYCRRSHYNTQSLWRRPRGKSQSISSWDTPLQRCLPCQAALGTLIYPNNQNDSPNTKALLSQEQKNLFQYTYQQIGVSKRCCPIPYNFAYKKVSTIKKVFLNKKHLGTNNNIVLCGVF